MKWIGNYTKEEKNRLKSEWYYWFAWYPVTVGLTQDKKRKKIWLSIVERKGTCYSDNWWKYEYKELKKKGGDTNESK